VRGPGLVERHLSTNVIFDLDENGAHPIFQIRDPQLVVAVVNVLILDQTLDILGSKEGGRPLVPKDDAALGPCLSLIGTHYDLSVLVLNRDFLALPVIDIHFFSVHNHVASNPTTAGTPAAHR
jgi:hypothetical protein